MPLKSVDFWNFEFKEDKMIKSLLKKGMNRIFSWMSLGILSDTEHGLKFSDEIKSIWKSFQVQNSNNEILKSFEISRQVEDIASKVLDILKDSPHYTVEGKKSIAGRVSYNAFIYWVLKLLESSWYDPKKNKKNLQDVPDKIGKIIFDILKDKALSALLVALKSFNLIDLSSNQINEYEVEEEIKVHDVNKEETIKKLERLWAEKVFEWEVHDIYYDYPKWYERLETSGWVKSTFRIRTRKYPDGTEKHFYTIKRKLTKQEEKKLENSGVLEPMWKFETRRCYEKELEIKDFDLFKKILKNFGLVKVREKKKERISYSLEKGNIKFDFDKYDGKKQLMEIESSKYSFIPEYIYKLGLERHKTSATWSQKFLGDTSNNE